MKIWRNGLNLNNFLNGISGCCSSMVLTNGSTSASGGLSTWRGDMFPKKWLLNNGFKPWNPFLCSMGYDKGVRQVPWSKMAKKQKTKTSGFHMVCPLLQSSGHWSLIWSLTDFIKLYTHSINQSSLHARQIAWRWKMSIFFRSAAVAVQSQYWNLIKINVSQIRRYWIILWKRFEWLLVKQNLFANF